MFMKAKFTRGVRIVMVLLAVLLAGQGMVYAQLPDCTSGNIMYLVFNNVAGSTTADSTEIRPVNVSTGVVGGLMGGKRYWLDRNSYYGSASLAVDMITNRFYVMTQMSSSSTQAKDIITINPVTGVQTVISTTPNSGGGSLRDYHFVKMAVAPNGWGYAIGVKADTSNAASSFNVLIRFSTCGASPSNGCGTIQTLGYLPSTGNMYKWKLFNGDIAFDVLGNMYFATAAYDKVGTAMKYTDARLFKINAADLPTSAGTGTIPMSFIADYDALDSTVINGIGLDAGGNMYLTTRRYLGPQGSSTPTVSELYASFAPGSTMIMSGFTVPTANFSVADVGSCYFPTTILGLNKMNLQYRYEEGNVKLKWEFVTAGKASAYEVQRSNNGTDFETIATVTPDPQQATYTYNDPQSGYETHKFYRIRAIMDASWKVYTNVVNVNFNHKVSLVANVRPNPFSSQMQAELWMKAANSINVRMLDQSGRVVYVKQFSGRQGQNQVNMNGLGNLKPGAYVLEMRVQDEVLREKVIKQ